MRLPTCDVDLHLAGAGADGVGGLADVGPCQAVVDGSPEEEGPVLSLHALGERAVQPVGWRDKARSLSCVVCQPPSELTVQSALEESR